jgi:hypothetical protein
MTTVGPVIAWNDAGQKSTSIIRSGAPENAAHLDVSSPPSLKEIAQTLALSPKTVANYQSAIKQRLGVDSAIQLLRKAGEFELEPAVPFD